MKHSVVLICCAEFKKWVCPSANSNSQGPFPVLKIPLWCIQQCERNHPGVTGKRKSSLLHCVIFTGTAESPGRSIPRRAAGHALKYKLMPLALA